VGSFLRNITHEKQVVGHMYSNVKRDFPGADGGTLFRDFRIDEEHGMSPDKRMEKAEFNYERLSLVDRI
jgi:hypothetical protein